MTRLSWFNVVSLTLGFAFLYIPMIILVIFSFNESKLVTVWAGFSTKWYSELLQNGIDHSRKQRASQKPPASHQDISGHGPKHRGDCR